MTEYEGYRELRLSGLPLLEKQRAWDLGQSDRSDRRGWYGKNLAENASTELKQYYTAGYNDQPRPVE